MEAALIAQIAPLIPSIIVSVENFFAMIGKKDVSGQQKLNAAVALASASSVAVAQSLATQPQNVTHLQSVINSAVAVANTFESFNHYMAAQQAGSGA